MNRNQTVLSSAARTVSPTSALEQAAGRVYADGFSNATGAALVVVIDITVVGTGSITVTISGIDKTSGKSWPILASAALVANATTVLRVIPGATVVANLTANDIMPDQFKVTVVANNANSVTYSVGAHVVDF